MAHRDSKQDAQAVDDRRAEHREGRTACGFCIDGVSIIRGRGGKPDRKVECPYCWPESAGAGGDGDCK